MSTIDLDEYGQLLGDYAELNSELERTKQSLSKQIENNALLQKMFDELLERYKAVSHLDKKFMEHMRKRYDCGGL